VKCASKTEPLSTGQVRAVMTQTVKSSDFVLGSSHVGLYFGLLVVALKGVFSIDPVVIAVGPDQLNYETQPKGAMTLRCEDRVGSCKYLVWRVAHSRNYQPRRSWLHPICP
jgi:hypothetical protein